MRSNSNYRHLVTTKILLVMVFLLTISGGCKQETNQTGNSIEELPVAEVSIARVTISAAPNEVEVVGTVQAVDSAEISARISGNILEIPVELGTKIDSGDLLVALSAAEISAQLQQADAQLVQAKRNLAREEKLLKKNAGTPESVKSYRDAVKIAAANHKEAKTMLSYTKITAPFAGTVTHKYANAGDLATPGKPLLRIEKDNLLQIQTDVPEALRHKIKQGDLLRAYIPSLDLHLQGEVTELSPIADFSSRTSPIKLKIAPHPNVRSGQFARVTFASETTKTMTVPTSAVVPYGQMERVFVVDDNKRAKLKLVRTGSKIKINDNEERVEILSGLNDNEPVIVSGNEILTNNQPVVIK